MLNSRNAVPSPKAYKPYQTSTSQLNHKHVQQDSPWELANKAGHKAAILVQNQQQGTKACANLSYRLLLGAELRQNCWRPLATCLLLL